MTDAHVRVENLGKAYKRYRGRWDRLAERCGWGRERHELLWAVRGVGFEARPGESIGVIGVNGAGKSTLLRLIAGITRPTEGGIRIQGSVAALFELGLGFHPDFTGRQNIRMEARLLGLGPDALRRREAGIEEFSELGDDLDRPLRYYSSGMRLRLAFSVATAARPDILLVDEALAVGDIHFRIKCIERILEFKSRGTLLLLVSHHADELYEICTRGLLLDRGAVALDGPIQDAVNLYETSIHKQVHRDPRQLSAGVLGTTGSINSTGASILSLRLLDAAGREVDGLPGGSTATFLVRIKFLKAYSNPTAGFRIRNKVGNVIFRTNTALLNEPIGPVKDGEVISVLFDFHANLAEGDYTISAYAADRAPQGTNFPRPQILSSAHAALTFTMVRDGCPNWGGVCDLFSSAKILRSQDSSYSSVSPEPPPLPSLGRGDRPASEGLGPLPAAE